VQALVEQSGPEKWVVAFCRESLPRDAAGRFGALFAQRARWEWCVYLVAVGREGGWNLLCLCVCVCVCVCVATGLGSRRPLPGLWSSLHG